MNIIWGLKILWIFFGGSSQNRTFGVISKHFMGFLKVKIQNGGFILRLLKFEIYFWGA